MSSPTPGETEDELLRRAQQGDEEALDRLLRLWQPSLEAIARSLNRRHARLGFDTHDLVATTIRRLLNIGPGGIKDAAGRALLRRIVQRVHIDKLREETARQRRETEVMRAMPERRVDAEPPHGVDLEAAPTTPEEWELVLLWKQGLSWTQISEHLGVSIDAARRRWHRLMHRLRVRRDPGADAGASELPDDPEGPRAGDPPSGRAAGRDPPDDLRA